MSAPEKRKVKRYLISADHDDDDAAANHAEDCDDEFNVLGDLAVQKKMAASYSTKSKYRCTNHILTTSVGVEY